MLKLFQIKLESVNMSARLFPTRSFNSRQHIVEPIKPTRLSSQRECNNLGFTAKTSPLLSLKQQFPNTYVLKQGRYICTFQFQQTRKISAIFTLILTNHSVALVKTQPFLCKRYNKKLNQSFV